MTNRVQENAGEGEGEYDVTPSQAHEKRNAQDDRDRRANLAVKIRLVGALWGICLLSPTLLFPAGWIRTTWVIFAVTVTCAVVIWVAVRSRKR